MDATNYGVAGNSRARLQGPGGYQCHSMIHKMMVYDGGIMSNYVGKAIGPGFQGIYPHLETDLCA